ncbi:MAG TPA: hypothetical protein VFX86_03990 [Candidatus Saccharimonadales bacterium]|nr:hypothetical protein [Candidatus Saccharimonadales bacterium]
MNFQGRLLNAQGATVPDGFYNIQFKIYQDGDGQTAGNTTGTPAGALKWTEDYLNANGDGIQVKNGFLSVELGSISPFGSSIDWNQDTLWLSMNIGGTGAACTPFSNCSPDGEMLPMKRLTSTPYSLNSGLLGGLSSSQYVQFAQGVQTDSSSNNSLYINKTGSGNLVVLQSSGVESFVIDNAGDVAFGANSDHTISVTTAAAGLAGRSLSIVSGDAAAGSNLAGGNLILQGGAGDGAGASGSVIVRSNTTNSAAAFQVQDSAGATVVNVDTATATAAIGNSTSQGSLAVHDGNGQTTTLRAGDSTGDLVFTLPVSTAAQAGDCLKDTSGTGTLGFADCADLTLQDSYNLSVGGTTPEIKVDTTRGALDIQDADTPTGGTLLAVRLSDDGGGLGDTILDVDVNGVGLGHSSALDGTLLFRNANNTNVVTLKSGATSSSYSITLPPALSGSGACLVDTDGNGTLGFSSCDGANAYVQGGNSFGATAVLGTTDPNSLSFITDSNTVLSLSGVNGAATFQNSDDSSSALRVSNAGGNSVLTVDTADGLVLFGSPGNVDGKLIVANATNTNTVTISSVAPSTNQSILLPNLSGTLCLSSGNCAGLGGNGDILQGGNNFGTDMVIGTNDPFNVSVETDGQTRLTVDTAGDVGIGGTSSGSRLSVSSAIDNIGAFTVVLTDDFDANIDSTQWTATGSTVADTSCDSDSGNSLRFEGSTRQAETIDVDVSSGGTVSFYIYSPNNGTGNCQEAEANEDLFLEYSTNNGANWTTIASYQADIDPMVQVNETIPAGAETSDTRFRWRQSSFSSGNDHWAIDTVMVAAFTGQGDGALSDDFDPSRDATQWSSTNNATADTVCGGSGSVSGNALRFDGAGQRDTTSNNIDSSGGGLISFYLYSPTGGGTGCEQPDAGENMVLEYSTNAGGNWTTINTYTPSANPITEINVLIPSGAQAASTLFRWRQATHSGSGFDNWSIDNVSITVNTPPGEIGSTIYAYNSSSDVTDLLRLASDFGGVESIKFRVESNGDVYADGTFFGAGGVTTGSADLAEVYRNYDRAKPGDVVVFTDPYSVVKSASPGQPGLAGVVSTRPGFTLNADEEGVPVALSGRVPVKVSVENGAIQKGDYLTSGPNGRAQKATGAGPTIGIALQNATHDGKIEVFVHLGYYDPVDEAISQGDVLLMLQSSDLAVAQLNVSGQASIGSLQVSENAYVGGKLTVRTAHIAFTLTLGSHIVSQSEAVTPEALAALGYEDKAPEDAVKSDGTDTAGNLNFTTGPTPADGKLLKITFHTPYESKPRVILEANNAHSAALQTFVTKTDDGFILHSITPPQADKTYSFDYIIIGSEVVKNP